MSKPRPPRHLSLVPTADERRTDSQPPDVADPALEVGPDFEAMVNGMVQSLDDQLDGLDGDERRRAAMTARVHQDGTIRVQRPQQSPS